MKTILPLLAIGCTLLVAGCYTEQRHGYAPGPAAEPSYAYEYYPDAEVYYEPQHHVYYWADGGAWRSGPRAPGNVALRSHVTVHVNSPEPYRHHAEVRAQHPPRQSEENQREGGHPDHDGH